MMPIDFTFFDFEPFDSSKNTHKVIRIFFANIKKEDAQLATLIRILALPHYFNYELINHLITKCEFKKIGNAEIILNKIKKYSFIYEIKPNTYIFHEIIRDSQRKYWHNKKVKKTYQKFSKYLKIYFEENDIDEMLFHWAVFDPDESFQRYQERIIIFKRNFDVGLYERLNSILKEQKWNFSKAQKLVLNYECAELQRLSSNWKGAIHTYRNLLKNTTITISLKGSAFYSLGSCILYSGHWRKAVAVLLKARIIAIEIGNKKLLTNVLLSIGWCYFRMTDFTLAISTLNEALILSKETKELSLQGWALNDLGRVYRQLESWDVSLEYYQECMKIWEKLQIESLIGRCNRNLGATMLRKGDLKNAQIHIDKALKIQKNNYDFFGLGYTLGTYGNYFQTIHEYNKAISYYLRSLEIFENLEATQEMYEISESLFQTYNDIHQYERASFFLKKYIDLKKILSREKRNE